jgi:hypothetical protein
MHSSLVAYSLWFYTILNFGNMYIIDLIHPYVHRFVNFCLSVLIAYEGQFLYVILFVSWSRFKPNFHLVHCRNNC